jgi:hypothetical protein
MSTTAIRVVFDAGSAFIEGRKAEIRRRIAACGDRSPLWVQRRQGWATSPEVARRVLDQLDARRIPYQVEDTAQTGLDLHVDLTLDYNAPEEPEPVPYWRGIRYGGGDGQHD